MTRFQQLRSHRSPSLSRCKNILVFFAGHNIVGIMFISFSVKSVSLILIIHLPTTVTRDCFYPDGSRPSPSEGDYFPCGPDSGPHSACCAKGDGCSTNGLCFGNAGYMYRGGCTDSNWTAPECAQSCKNGTSIILELVRQTCLGSLCKCRHLPVLVFVHSTDNDKRLKTALATSCLVRS